MYSSTLARPEENVGNVSKVHEKSVNTEENRELQSKIKSIRKNMRQTSLLFMVTILWLEPSV